MKLNTPREVALAGALIISLLTALVIAIMAIVSGLAWWWLAVAPVLLFAGTYFLLLFLIERFIYRKVKLIYKTIHSLKVSKGADIEFNMNDDVLLDVNSEVLSWAKDSKAEIKQLKELEEFRRRFIGNVAHELKTPVFSIQGYILTLLEGAMDDDPEIQRDFLMRAAKGVDRMTRIIEDLDTITRYESKQMEIELERTNLVELAAEVMESLELKARKRKIAVGFKEAYEKPIWVKADAGRIAQVLTNLMVNAINYGKEDGNIQIRFYDLDQNILIEVADDGLGIAEKHLPHLFERFYRVDKSRARHEGGTGLGLAIVKHIIEAHGQTISVRSGEGVGSTFSFTLEKSQKSDKKSD